MTPSIASREAGLELRPPSLADLNPPSLLELYSRAHEVPVERALTQFLLASVAPAKRPLLLLFRTLSPGTFSPDRAIITQVLQARTHQEVREAVSGMRSRIRGKESFVRRTLGIRASGRRILSLSERLFSAPELVGAQPAVSFSPVSPHPSPISLTSPAPLPARPRAVECSLSGMTAACPQNARRSHIKHTTEKHTYTT